MALSLPMLIDAKGMETPTSDFQTWDLTPRLQKQRIQPSGPYCPNTLERAGTKTLGSERAPCKVREHPKLLPQTRPRDPRATPGLLSWSVAGEGLTSAYAELSTGQQSRNARPGAIRVAPIATA